MSDVTIGQGSVRANDVDFAFLESGPSDGPLALCLHGFPDSAWTWRHLLPALAGQGYRAVAPWLRGYAPTSVPADGRYQTGALVADACALHEALGGDGRAVVIGHDWGTAGAYGAPNLAPERWHRAVAAAVPPSGAMGGGFLRYDQLRRSWYMFLFQHPLADIAVAMDDLAFIDRLWADWSPGYDASEDLPRVKESLRDPANLTAALGYYRAVFGSGHVPDLAAEQEAASAPVVTPTLYLHGADDGCVGMELAENAGAFLGEGSAVRIIEGAGHFLHLEKPDEVNAAILEFLRG